MSISMMRLGGAAVLLGMVAGVMVVALRDTDDVRRAADTAEAGTPAPSPDHATPAALDGPVTRISTGPSAPRALSLVARAPTVVLAAPGATGLPAAHLALRLQVPLVLSSSAPSTGTASDAPAIGGAPSARPPVTGGAPSPGPSAPGTASDAPSTGGAQSVVHVVVPADLRRLRVRRAVVVGPAALADAARDAGVRNVVRVDAPPADAPASAPAGTGAQAIIATAAGGPGSPPPDTGFDDDVIDRLLADAPPAPPASGVAVLVRPRDATALPVVLAARGVGHAVVTTRADDLRADDRVVARLAALGDRMRPPPIVLGGIRMARVDRELIAAYAATAARGDRLPGGGQLVVDPRRPHARRYVGLYGTPGTPALGVLGEQPVRDAVTRAKRLARRYRRVTPDRVTVLPCFEIIATVATVEPGRDGNYARERPVARLAPAVDVARESGLYVLLDIQPGRADFLTQARRYRRLLRQPHVGLALDPEWRLRPGQRHLRQIGSVGIDEVNAVVDWLADLVDRNDLPQKMLLIHQFRRSMVRDRARLDTSRRELAYVIQMDGQGPQGTKLDTWRSITGSPPDGVQFGWKNFYDEDTPVRSPADTMALSPPPVFVSYQ